MTFHNRSDRSVQHLFAYMKNFRLAEDQCVILRSSLLVLRSVIEAHDDGDMMRRRNSRTDARAIEALQIDDDYHKEIVTLFDDQVTFGNNRGSAGFAADGCIGDAEYIDALPVVNLQRALGSQMRRAVGEDLQRIGSLKESRYFALRAGKERRSPGAGSRPGCRCWPGGRAAEASSTRATCAPARVM